MPLSSNSPGCLCCDWGRSQRWLFGTWALECIYLRIKSSTGVDGCLQLCKLGKRISIVLSNSGTSKSSVELTLRMNCIAALLQDALDVVHTTNFLLHSFQSS